MKIYLVRHGETDWNKKRKIQGQADIPLNETGEKTARITGKELSQISYDRVYVSPLKRTVRTAELLTGSTKDALCFDDRLLEISYGVREGQNLNLIELLPILKLHKFFKQPEKYVPPKNGETFEMLRSRVVDFFLNEILPLDNTLQNAMIVTHGGFIRETVCWINHIPRTKFWNGCEQKNCAVTTLELINKQFSVIQEGKIYY